MVNAAVDATLNSTVKEAKDACRPTLHKNRSVMLSVVSVICRTTKLNSLQLVNSQANEKRVDYLLINKSRFVTLSSLSYEEPLAISAILNSYS